MNIYIKSFFLFFILLTICNKTFCQTISKSAEKEIHNLYQIVDAGQWQDAAKKSEKLLKKHNLSVQCTNGWPIGYVLEYIKGMSLRRHKILKSSQEQNATSAINSYRALQNATAWLYSVCGNNASDAWADVYYELGSSCKQIGRYDDAEAYFTASSLYALSNTQKIIKSQLELVALALKRTWYKPAYDKINKLWPKLGNTPPKKAYYYYALALLSQKKDKQAYDILLDCIALYGISPKLADKDPLFRLFLDYLGRADDNHITTFYDLMGMQLDTMNLKATAKELAALLINQRNIMSKCFPYLNKERDFDRLKTRFLIESTGNWDDDFMQEELSIDNDLKYNL